MKTGFSDKLEEILLDKTFSYLLVPSIYIVFISVTNPTALSRSIVRLSS